MTRVLCLFLLAAFCQRPHDKPAPPEARKGQKKGEGRAPETILYVDGVPRASISFGELTRLGRQPLCDYLASLETPCSTVRALHVYAEAVTPIADLAAAQLEVEPGRAPRIAGVEAHAVTVYVQKPPPPLPVQGIPYLDERVRGGTRINLDGKLATRLKRNQIEGELPEGPDGYLLTDFLQQQKLTVPKAVELVMSDDQVVRVPDAEIARLRFQAEPEKHGQMSFRFAGRAVSTVAVNLYAAVAPPVRELARATPVTATAHHAGFNAGCSVVW